MVRSLGLLLVTACRPPASFLDSGATATLDAAVFTPRRIAVDAPADVIVPDTVGVTRNDVWGKEICLGAECVLPLVHPAERVTLHLADGDAADRSVELRALPVPVATPIAPGTIHRSRLAPVSADDPRGPLADLAFTLDSPRRVTIDWTTQFAGGDREGAPHQVDAALFGPAGSEQAEVFGQFDAPEHHENTWELAAGRYVLRLTPAREPRLACEAYETPFGVTAVPAWCALPDDEGPYEVLTEIRLLDPESDAVPPEAPPPADVVLTPGGSAMVAPGRAPDAPVLRIPARRGEDLVVRWTPADAELVYSWKSPQGESSGVCEAHACRFWAAEFDAVDVRLGVREAPQRVEVSSVSLPLPTERIELHPGEVATVTPAASDARGPIVDFELVVPAPGRYRIGVAYPEGSQQPWIHPLGDGLQDTFLTAMSADPYEARWYDVEQPGVYAVRVDTCPDCPEVELQVEWQTESE